PGDLAVAAAEPNASEPAAATAAAPNEDAAGSGSAIEQPPSELESLLILAAARRERGDLITPDSDSARTPTSSARWRRSMQAMSACAAPGTNSAPRSRRRRST